MRTGLERLLRPQSLAVIGGGSWCENVIRKSREFGFAGPIWPVHPTKRHMGGEQVFASVNDLPDAPDASFIGINRQAAIGAVAELSARGGGGAVCFASGFSESAAEDATGVELQDRLLRAAGDMTLLGPNCYGFINGLDGALLWPDQHGAVATETGVAVITQSSNIAINLTMQQRALPLAYMVTTGNQAQTGMAEIGLELLKDQRVSALGLHIEGIADVAAMARLAEFARSVGKPVVVLKVGRSAQAQAATISHTASLAGSSTGADALLQRLGLPQVANLPEFLEALKLLHLFGGLASNRIACLSCSGGEASLMADLAEPSGVEFPELTITQHQGLRKALGGMVKLANPLDYHTYIWNDVEAMAATFIAMAQADLGMLILVVDFPRADRCDPSDWDCVLSAIEQAKDRIDIPIAIASSLPENIPEDVAERLIAGGVVPLCGLGEALVAARVGAQWGETRPAVNAVLPPLVPKNCNILGEAQAKAALSAFGLNCPASRRFAGVGELAHGLHDLTFPVVLKGEGMVHKTEVGGVVLNLNSADQVVAAASGMDCDGFLVEEMVTGVICELLVGIVLDPAHGYVLTIGAGGVMTELLEDSVSLMVPATAKDIRKAIDGLRISAVIRGYRGQPAADLSAVVNAVQALQNYVLDQHGYVEEVEINPLLCLQNGAIAVDALIRTGEMDDGRTD